MADRDEDLAVEYFLELDGTVHFVDGKCKYRVKITAKRTDVTPERPHGLSYSLTLHNEKYERILGFDNAHPVPANKGPSTSFMITSIDMKELVFINLKIQASCFQISMHQ